MNPNDLSGFIKKLMNNKNLSLQKIADEMYITKQAIHNWLQRRTNVDWKIESLLKLSEILDFNLIISKGKLYVEENNDMNEKENQLILNQEKGVLETINAKNNEVIYDVYKKFYTHSIIKLYAPNTAVNDDIEATLLDEWINCYNTVKECMDERKCESVVEVYALLDNLSGEVVEDCVPSLYHDDIETLYLCHYAPPFERTADGYEVVSIRKDLNIQIVRAYANGFVYNRKMYRTDLSSTYVDGYMFGLIAIPIDEPYVKSDCIWQPNIKYIYKSINPNYTWNRYFDKDRNEIKAGDIIVLDEFNDYIEEDFYDVYSGEYGYLDNYEIGDKLEVFSCSNGLCIYADGCGYDLNALQLLKWKKIR